MAIDFRNPEQHTGKTDPAAPAALAPAAAGPRRVVLGALMAMAVVMFVLGAWALLAPLPWFSPDIQPLIGMALVLTAIGDAVAALVLHRIWRRAGR